MQTPSYDDLFVAALNDVQSGTAAKRNCGVDDECRLMTGCVRCAGVLRGEVGIERVDIYPDAVGDHGIIRVTTTGNHKSPLPCVVSFKVPIKIRPTASKTEEER